MNEQNNGLTQFQTIQITTWLLVLILSEKHLSLITKICYT